MMTDREEPPIKITTISELIAALEDVRGQCGDAPVVMSDTDTGWEMPIIALAVTADGHVLLEPVGYTYHKEVRAPAKPIRNLWCLEGFE